MYNKAINHIFNEFVVCGLDLKDIELDSTEDCSEESKSIERYKSSILLQIPFSAGEVDDSIKKLCLPDDIQVDEDSSAEIMFHPFVLVRANGEKQYGGSLVYKERLNTNEIEEFADQRAEWIYATKSICLTSSLPMCDCIQRILTIIHKANFSEDSHAPLNKLLLEKYIFIILYELAMPNPKSALILSLYHENVYIYSLDHYNFQFFDFDIRSVIQSLTPKIVLKLLSHVMNESRVLIVGPDYSQMVRITETLLALMYPFSWPHTYVPIIPRSMITLLEAPFPFIMGIRDSNFDWNNEVVSKYCVFDINSNSIRSSKTVPPLPFTKELSEELEATMQIVANTPTFQRSHSVSSVQQRLHGSEGHSQLSIQFYNALAREIFLNYFIQLLNNYTDYVTVSKQFNSMTDWINKRKDIDNFDRKKFLTNQSKQTQSFLSMFTTAQMFVSFVDSVISLKWKEGDENLKVFMKKRNDYFNGLTSDEKSPGMIYHRTCSSIPDLEDSFLKILDDMVVRRVKHEASTDDILPGKRSIANYEDLAWSTMFSVKRKIGIFKYSVYKRKDHRKSILTRKSSVFALQRRKSIDQRFMNNDSIYTQLLAECSLKGKLFFVDSTKNYSNYSTTSNAEQEGEGDIGEAMIVSSFSDLLQRIWSHNARNPKITCPLWYHLQCYTVMNNTVYSRRLSIDSKMENALTWCIMRKKLNPFRDNEETKISVAGKLLVLSNIVETLDSIKQLNWTDNGKVEAFIRLCLEYRVLKECISCLFSESDLLRRLYKHDAFLRQDSKRESFLLNMEACSFACYSSFTNHYTELIVGYRINFKSSSKTMKLNNAKPLLTIFGTLAKSNLITFPNDVKSFNVKRPNMGELTLIYIDHDHKGSGNRFSVDNVTIENTLTKRSYGFKCKHLYKVYGNHDLSGRYVPGEQIGEDETSKTS
ncbi:hypothetical protein ACOME3_001529 [Neoechinorhynchus agilis]